MISLSRVQIRITTEPVDAEHTHVVIERQGWLRWRITYDEIVHNNQAADVIVAATRKAISA